MTQRKTRIVAYCAGAGEWWTGRAVADDGTVVAAHLSSSPEWSAIDLGDTPQGKQADYRRLYPGGYEFAWLGVVQDLDAHAELRALYALNQQRAAGPKTAENTGVES